MTQRRKTYGKRCAYIKEISKNMFHVCLEYGIEVSQLENKGIKVQKDNVLSQHRNIRDAIVSRNRINNKVIFT